VTASSERSFDLAASAALALIGAGVLVRSSPAERASPVVLLLVALNWTAAVLIFRRDHARAEASTKVAGASLPGVFVGTVAFALAPPIVAWGLGPIVVALFGGAIAVASLATLGKSFSILPAARAVVTHGPYRVVRHPAYFGELMIVAAAALARRDPVGAAILVVAVALIAVRVVLEERILATDEAYSAYVNKVRYRLLFGVW
jgi:protein-S-isoprenylcysteine O-methyltransferase Ste14